MPIRDCAKSTALAGRNCSGAFPWSLARWEATVMVDFNGFNVPEYTQAPNNLFDDLLPQIDSLSELKVLLFAIRKTLGWHQETDYISITQFCQGTGLSRQGVIDGIQACIKRGT